MPSLTRDEALLLLNNHIGGTVSVLLEMDNGGNSLAVLPPVSGPLGKRALADSGDDGIDADDITLAKASIDPMYTVGGQRLGLPPLPGIIRRYEVGLEWVLAEGLALRIDWGRDDDAGEIVTIPEATSLSAEDDEGDD
ncbi:MAG TPA: hypothetical protein VK721_15090 [Solirubrobacteraceae bacterium]|nr:hypothetical protein [Solirubrobacteraceae bacterium]